MFQSQFRARPAFRLSSNAKRFYQRLVKLVGCLNLRGVPQIRKLDQLSIRNALGGGPTELGKIPKPLRHVRRRTIAADRVGTPVRPSDRRLCLRYAELAAGKQPHKKHDGEGEEAQNPARLRPH
jgi:type VI protein secretion system component VasK